MSEKPVQPSVPWTPPSHATPLTSEERRGFMELSTMEFVGISAPSSVQLLAQRYEATIQKLEAHACVSAERAEPSALQKCGAMAFPLIPRRGEYFTCVLAAGHDGPHRGGGTCFKHGAYVGEPDKPPRCPHWPTCVADVPMTDEARASLRAASPSVSERDRPTDFEPSYSNITRAIERCPMTYVPALLMAVVRRAVRSKVFAEGGLMHTVERAMTTKED